LRPIDIKRIARENFESRLPKPAFPKVINQRVVKFNRADAIRMGKQMFGQRAAARPDLDRQPGMFPASRNSDALQNLAADEKMLPEFLTRQFVRVVFS
jgi:alpha-D-ribose 1-methylphosphonate 5-triphosphate synthase subunit PhnI